MMKHTINNFKELPKDGRCILKGIKGVGLGIGNGIFHLLKTPVCLIQDARDAYLQGKSKKENTVVVIEPEVVNE